MKRLFVLFVLVLVGLPATTGAQSRRPYSGRYYEVRDAIYGRGDDYPTRGRYGYGGGYYDPAYLNQMFALPEALVACRMDINGRVEGCHALLKSIEYMETHAERHEDLNEVLGTYHAEKGRMHFRPFDSTNHRLGKAGTMVVGTVAGAAGGGAVDGRRGAVIGGGIGAFAGWLASRKANKHDNCLEIGGRVRQATAETAIEQEESPLGSYVEQGTKGSVTDLATRDESHGPAFRSGPHTLTNASRVYVDVYDGDRKPENLVGSMESGDSLDLARPRNRYRGWAQVPNNKGSFDAEELGIEVGATGWTFIEPAVARGRS